jgi:hypothetical protein
VRTTIEQNFEALEAVFNDHGLAMDPAAAQRRATRARAAFGWHTGEAAEALVEDRPLRLVGAKGA